MTGGPVVRRRRNTSPGGEDGDSASSLPTPPDGGWGWMVVFGSFMIHIIADGVTYTFGIFFVEFLEYYGGGKGATSWIASILVGITLGTGPIASALTNKYGCRVVTIAGATLATAGLLASLFAPNIETLYFTIGVCAGLGFGLIYLPAIVSVTCYFEKRRAFATGIAVCGSGLGTFIFAPLIEILVENYGWKGAMLLVAGLVLNCTVFGALFRPLSAPSSPTKVQQSICEHTPAETEKLMNGIPPKLRAELIVPPSPMQQQVDLLSNGHTLTTISPEQVTDGLRMSMSAHNLTSQRQVPLKILGSHKSLMLGSHQSLMNRPVEEDLAIPQGVMYRKDIFYSGSLLNIPQYRRQFSWPGYPAVSELSPDDYVELVKLYNVANNNCSPESSNPQMYTMSINHIPKQYVKDRPAILSCCECSKETRDTLTEMMDLSILKDPIFVLFAISNFCTSIGFNVPYVYIKDRALLQGVSRDDSSFLIAIIGIANTISRVVLGYISDKPWLNRLWLYNSALTLCGLSTMFSAFCLDYTSMAFYAAIFGVTAGAYVGLTSVILVDLLGLEKLTNAFGLLLLFQGVASLVGPPITGSLYDWLQSYDPGFYVAGAMIAISGSMLFVIPVIRWWQVKRKEAKNAARHVEDGTLTQDTLMQNIPQLTVASPGGRRSGVVVGGIGATSSVEECAI